MGARVIREVRELEDVFEQTTVPSRIPSDTDDISAWIQGIEDLADGTLNGIYLYSARWYDPATGHYSAVPWDPPNDMPAIVPTGELTNGRARITTQALTTAAPQTGGIVYRLFRSLVTNLGTFPAPGS